MQFGRNIHAHFKMFFHSFGNPLFFFDAAPSSGQKFNLYKKQDFSTFSFPSLVECHLTEMKVEHSFLVDALQKDSVHF